MKYVLPEFLSKVCARAVYVRWLQRKADAHAKRDSLRLKKKIVKEDYRRAIHLAVAASNGLDYFTKEKLDWTLISRYDNAESKRLGRDYKRRFALLPTVDHDPEESGSFTFRICSWRTNDSKHDLTIKEFRDLCRLILKHAPE